ncbi:MAG: hypothetical protein AAF514_15815, partial [Verrucomicrobiota bacterium]
MGAGIEDVAELHHCRKRLEPYRVSVKEAVDQFIASTERRKHSVSIDDLFAEFLGDKGEQRERYLEGIRQVKARIADQLEVAFISDVSKRMVLDILDGEKLTPNSFNNYRRQLSAVFSFAMTHHGLQHGSLP